MGPDKTADDRPKERGRNAAQSAVNQRTKPGAFEPRRDLGTGLRKPGRPEDEADKRAADERRNRPERGSESSTAQPAE